LRQYNDDLKFRMQLADARNRVLIDLVQGLTVDPDHFAPQSEKLASADSSLKSLDRDVEALLSSVRHSRQDAEALRAQREALTNELAQARRTIETARVSQAQVDARVTALQQILAPLTDLIQGGRINVSVAYGRLSIDLPEAALFAQGDQRLSADGKSLLTRVVMGLRTAPDRQYRVVGPSDAPGKAGALKREQTHARTIAVLDYLVTSGVAADSLAATSQSAPSTKQPQSDRYFEIVLMPKAEELPRLPSSEELLAPAPVSAGSS
jgi:outer membrane protein OmpA-like peptidoglycan-associated protein